MPKSELFDDLRKVCKTKRESILVARAYLAGRLDANTQLAEALVVMTDKSFKEMQQILSGEFDGL